MSEPAKPKNKSMNPWLKLALEMGPLVAFFIANGRMGILQGTAVFMVATVAALGISYAIARTIPIMPLVGGVFVLFFGGLTVLLEDDLFIKLKPTIVNLLFAGILTAGLVMNRLFIKIVLEFALHLTERGWLVLTRAWIAYFVVMAAANEVVWRNFPTDFWVKYKVFGVMPMTVLFSFLVMALVLKHVIPDDSARDSAQ